MGNGMAISGAPSKKTVKSVLMPDAKATQKYSVRVNRNGRYSHKFKMEKSGS